MQLTSVVDMALRSVSSAEDSCRSGTSFASAANAAASAALESLVFRLPAKGAKSDANLHSCSVCVIPADKGPRHHPFSNDLLMALQNTSPVHGHMKAS